MQLWQTSRSHELGSRAQQLCRTWLDLNPGLPAVLMNDTEAASFIHNHFGKHVHAVYASYPLTVMRADLWRYAVLYALGGVYADIDTEALQPLQRWFPPRQTGPKDPAFVSDTKPNWEAAGPVQYFDLSWEDCSLVAGLENDAHMCQWIIAAAPGHPVLRSVLELAMRSVEHGVNCTYEHLVHQHTGPGIFTQAFRQVLGLPDGTSAAGIAQAAWTNTTVHQRARQLRICIVASTFWGAPEPHDTSAQNAQNLYSSSWKAGNPNGRSWVQEREQLLKAAAAASSNSSSRAASTSSGAL